MSLFLGYIVVTIGIAITYFIQGSDFNRDDVIFYLVFTGAASAMGSWFEVRDKGR